MNTLIIIQLRVESRHKLAALTSRHDMAVNLGKSLSIAVNPVDVRSADKSHRNLADAFKL